MEIIFALFSSFVLGVWSLNWFIDNKYPHRAEAEVAIAQCEARLPRDQHCKLTAVPATGDKQNGN